MHTGHLQAEARKIIGIKASKIEIIEEEGHEGMKLICASNV
jgi:hypothetical protein